MKRNRRNDAVVDSLESRRMFASHPVAINFCDEALWAEHFETAVGQAKQLGVTSVRVWMGYDTLNDRPNAWDPIQPFGAYSLGELPPGTPRSNNGGQVMRRLFQLKREGFHVMVILNDSQGDAPSSSTQVKSFIRHLMDSPEVSGGTETLKDVVDMWQIGNEIDSASYWKPSGIDKTTGIQRYVNELLIPAAEELKKGANEQVVSAGPSWSTGDLSLILSTAKNAGKLNLIDYAGYHPYGSYDPTIVGSSNQIKDRTTSAVQVGNGFGKKLIASEWNIRGFGNTGANNAKWVAAMDEVYRTVIVPNYDIAYYFQLINNWPARGGTVSARPGGLLKHDTTIQVTPSSPILDLRAYYQAPLVVADPFYSTFAKWQEGSVSGVVVNASATHASMVVPPVTVYVDLNNDGALSANEPTTQTDETGKFKLLYTSRQFAAGTYTLRAVLPEGWTEAYPLANVPLSAGTTRTEVQVSLLPAGDTEVRPGTIGGILWNDTNADGVFATSELRTGSRQIYIDVNANGAFDTGEPTTNSDANGVYQFVGLLPGTYNITRVFPAGYRLSNSTLPYIQVTVAPGQVISNANIGTTSLPAPVPPKPVTTGSLSGRVWNDVDGDGAFDWNESGIAGRTVWVDFNGDGIKDVGELSATTAVDGTFTISYDSAVTTTGEYTIRQQLGTDWEQTTLLRTVVIGAARADTGVLIGSRLIQTSPPVLTGTVSGTHFQDSNANGVQDIGELPIANRRVFLDLDRSFTYNAGEPTTLTDADGNFTLVYDTAGIPAGTHRLGQMLPAGWSQTVGTPQITVGAGNAVTGLKIGSYLIPVEPQITVGTVAGKQFQDDNANGVLDEGELPIADRRVFIDVNDNQTYDLGEPAALTNGDGEFTITYDTLTTAPGAYHLRQVLPTGWSQTVSTAPFNVGAGNALTGLVIGSYLVPIEPPITTGTVSGTHYHDSNGDGVQDDGEQPIVGRLVFIDLNGNDAYEVGEPAGLTDGNGEFAITYDTNSVAANTYPLAQVLPAGWSQTVTAPQVNVGAGNSAAGLLVGSYLVPVEPEITTGAVSGKQFQDSNANGVQDQGEPPIQGRQVFIDLNDNQTYETGEPTAQTNADGEFTIPYDTLSTSPGSYRLAQVLPIGWSQTTISPLVEIAAKKLTTGLVIGSRLTPVTTGSVSGTHFQDSNANGVQDIGELPIANRRVFLDLDRSFTYNAGEPTTLTDADGNFTLVYDTAGIPAGTHRLGQMLPAGWSQTVGTPQITVGAGNTVTGLKIGSYLIPVVTTGSLAGKLWNDADANGATGSGEAGISGRTVYVDLNNNSLLDSGEPSALTDADGAYLVNYDTALVAAGSYSLRSVVPAGWESTTAVPTITLASKRADVGVNLGSRLIPLPTTGTVAGRLWKDDDADQTINTGETGIAGRTVYIDLDNDNILDSNEPSGQTNASGDFVIGYDTKVVPIGVYAIRQQLPAGWEQTTLATSVTVGSNRADTGLLMGSRLTPVVPSDPKNASISGILWNDGNGDGVMGTSEGRTGARQVYIDTNGNKKFDAGEPSVMADAQGNYRFTGLAAGTYNVSRVFPAGYRMSNSTTGLLSVAVTASQQVTNANIGTTDKAVVVPPVIPPVTAGVISGVHFNDVNGNGIRDVGEVAISGRDVFIDLNNNFIYDVNEPIATTNASGQFTLNYNTATVPAGTYRLGQRLPSGWSQTVGTPQVTLAAGKTETGLLIGSRNTTVTPPPVDPKTASISGFLWNDGNANGKVDGTDSRTGARQVFIDTNGNKKLDAGEVSLTADAQGNFRFTGLAAGTYNLTRVFPAGYRMSNSSTGLLTVTVAAGQQYLNANIGTTNR